MKIDRCVCANRTLADLVGEARREGLDFDQLCDRSGASQGCELCKPYLREAMKTGQTVFYQILVEPPAEDSRSA